MATSRRLTEELETFRRVVGDLICGHLDDYVVIIGSEVAEIIPHTIDGQGRTVHPTAAILAAHARYGSQPFLFKRIRRPQDEPQLSVYQPMAGS